MQLENSFTVPVPIEDAWRVLLDIERIAPCMPGAVLDSVEGDAFTGRVKVKLGPIALTYAGKASFVEKDEAAHRAVIDAKGKDQRGNGTAAAVITARLAEEGSVTRVDVLTDLNITGKPAQFGRGVMTDVGNKLLGQFADKLAAQLAESPDVAADEDAAAQQQEPTVTTAVAAAASSAAATAAGVAEEVAASAEQVPGDGAAAETARKAGTAAKKAAAAASESVRTTQEIPKKAVAKKAAEKDGAAEKAAPATKLAAQTATPPDPTEVPAKKATADATTPMPRPSTPPSGPSSPPSRPSTGAPTRSTPSGVSRPQQSEPEPIDLLEVAGGAAMTRLALPAAGVAGVLLLITLVVRRRRRR